MEQPAATTTITQLTLLVLSLSFQDVLVNQPVVIDNGSGSTKAGFAGQDHPKCFFPSL